MTSGKTNNQNPLVVCYFPAGTQWDALGEVHGASLQCCLHISAVYFSFILLRKFSALLTSWIET